MKSIEYPYHVLNNSLFILESLVAESLTGKWLYDDLAPLSYANDRLHIEYFAFESKEAFLNILARISTMVEKENKYPTIHIEAHGDQNGFEVAHTKEEITWLELNAHLLKINLLSRNNLIISLGICFGDYLNYDAYKYFEKESGCPYTIIVSPVSKISSGEIKFGFSNFYQSLFKLKDFDSSMNEMRKETNLNTLDAADLIAIQIIDSGKKFILDPSRNSAHLEYLISKGDELLPNKTFNKNLKALKRFKREFLKNDYQSKWDKFLMIDKFEENRSKFTDFESIWDKI